MMKVPHLSWDTWLMMIILIEIEILSKYHFWFCSSVCVYGREICIVHCKRNIWYVFYINFGLADSFKLFQPVFTLTRKQYQLEEICLKFPKIKATGGVKTHPGLVWFSDAASSVCICHWLKLQPPGEVCMVLRVLVLSGHSKCESYCKSHFFISRSACFYWPFETSSPCSAMSAFLIPMAFPLLNLPFFC